MADLSAQDVRRALVEGERFRIESMRTWAWRRLVKLAKGADSEMVRLLALKEFTDRLDPKPRAADADDAQRPVNVAIVLTQPAESRAALHAHGVRLHLSDGERNGA